MATYFWINSYDCVSVHVFHLVQLRFLLFDYVEFPISTTMISIREDVGQEVSSTLWTQRQLDVIALAFLLFATATCCRAMLRGKGGGRDLLPTRRGDIPANSPFLRFPWLLKNS